MRATFYSRIELWLAWSKVSPKVCGVTFRSISLHLTRKRIKEILTQKHHYNSNYLSRFNDKNAFRKWNESIYFFQILAVCTGVYMHATFLVVEIADSSLGQALNGQHFIADKEPPKQFFLSLKETWICFNHNIVWQLIEDQPCVLIFRPRHILCIFKIDHVM